MTGAGFDLKAVKDALWTWAGAASGLGDKVAWLYENAPRPSKPYITLNMVGPRVVAGTENLRTINGVQTMCGLREFTLSINCYDDEDAQSIAAILQSSLGLPTFWEPLVAAGIGWSRMEEVTDLSAVLETKWERRAHFDLHFYVAAAVDMPEMSTIETANVTSSLFRG